MYQAFMEDELKELIIEDYKGGLSVLGIATKYNMYRRAVHDILKDTIITEADRVVPYHGNGKYGRRPQMHTGKTPVVVTPEIEARIEAVYAESGNVTKAATEAGVSWLTARKVLFVNGCMPMRSRRRAWTCAETPADVKAGMVREYKKGKGINKVAAMFDSSYPTVRTILIEAGVDVQSRKSEKITPEVAADIVRDYLSGSTFDELRETYRRSYRTMRKAITDAGVPIRKCGSVSKIVPPYTARALGLA